MKNRKIILVVIAMIILSMVIMPCVKASNDNLTIIENGADNSNTDNTNTNNAISNEPNTNTNTNTNNNTGITDAAQNTLPQTGVAENTALFVFIAVCLVSAIYAYIKIKNYRGL